MLRAIDTSAAALGSFGPEGFDLERWKQYMDACVPSAKALCLQDMESCVSAGYAWERCFFPVLNAVRQSPDKLAQTVHAFHRVVEGLEQRLLSRFGKSADADLILYLGLCSGAGWAVRLDGRAAVLLGLEKIIELGWYGTDDMNGLILHELGHIWQGQYGVLTRRLPEPADALLWQLFTEGVAMVFEQELLGDPDYYHQDKNGWKLWCAQNEARIARRFAEDLRVMTPLVQNYFGDWVRFEGQPDVGYYLGAKFVRFLLREEEFDRILSCDMAQVRTAFRRYLESIGP